MKTLPFAIAVLAVLALLATPALADPTPPGWISGPDPTTISGPEQPTTISSPAPGWISSSMTPPTGSLFLPTVKAIAVPAPALERLVAHPALTLLLGRWQTTDAAGKTVHIVIAHGGRVSWSGQAGHWRLADGIRPLVVRKGSQTWRAGLLRGGDLELFDGHGWLRLER